MSSKEDLLRTLSVKKLRELSEENKIPLIYRDENVLFPTGTLAKTKDEMIQALNVGRLSIKKIEEKAFGSSKKKTSSKAEIKSIKRKSPSKAQQTEILKRQHHKCALCSKDISKLPVIHYDHKRPIELGGSNTLRNYQALCPDCHAIKTQQDRHKIALAKSKETK
jgi:5-methylcytosine-specific restriction endonuclease McrA